MFASVVEVPGGGGVTIMTGINDFVEAYHVMVKFPGRALGVDVFSAEENLVMNLELRSFLYESIIVFCLSFLSLGDVVCKLLVNGLESLKVVGDCWDFHLRLNC